MSAHTAWFSPQTQHPIAWHRAEGEFVFDGTGRCYIDFTSGCLIANAGHGNTQIRQEIEDCLRSGVFTSYGFGNPWKHKLLELLADVSPHTQPGLHLLSTGAETVEFALKLACMRKAGNKDLPMVVGFRHAFHGRTLGAQAAGGLPHLKSWIPTLPFRMVELPFEADGPTLERHLAAIAPGTVAALIFEPYLGGTVQSFSTAAIRAMHAFCRERGALLIADEVQSGFFRTGPLFHSCRDGLPPPDLILCGKGISSSLPLSCVMAEARLLQTMESGQISSTHSGNPLCCAAAYGNLRFLLDNNVEGQVPGLAALAAEQLAVLHGILPQLTIRQAGLAIGVDFHDTAWAAAVVMAGIDAGLMLFKPVGPAGTVIKLVPPLIITPASLRTGLEIFASACCATAPKPRSLSLCL